MAENESPAPRKGRARKHEGLRETFYYPQNATSKQRQQELRWCSNDERWLMYSCAVVPEWFVEQVRSELDEWRERTFSHFGSRPFESLKPGAAWHEAGHCVMSALDGTLPTSARIWSARKRGELRWLGAVEGITGWWLDSTTPAQVDLKGARMLMAGPMAEWVFDRTGHHPGVWGEELLFAAAPISLAAYKLKRDAAELTRETVECVCLRLVWHAAVVRTIADELLRKHAITSRRLALLLRPVGRSGQTLH